MDEISRLEFHFMPGFPSSISFESERFNSSIKKATFMRYDTKIARYKV